MSGAWSCPHESNGLCTKVNNLPCDPGMKGCVLAGRYIFFGSDQKNERLRRKLAREETEAGTADPPAGEDDDGGAA